MYYIRNILIIVVIIFSKNVVISQKFETKDGYVKFFYENGKVSSEGIMKDGKPDGYWRTYYPNGMLKSEGNRRFFMLDSIWIFYNEKGDTSQIINYKNDKKNGYLITYEWKYDSIKGKNGGIISKELYIDDKKQGISYYYKNGKIQREVYYKDGKKDGIAKEYDENGNIITIIEYRNDFIISREFINRKDSKGLKQGVWKTFYPNNKVAKEVIYKNDTIVGYYKEYEQDGKIKIKKYYEKGKEVQITEKDTLQEIEWKEEFYETGKRKYLGAYKNGVKIGIHKEYDPEGKAIVAKEYNENGILISEGMMDSLDRKQSEWKEYYETGEIKAKGKYYNNYKTDEWIYYYPSGKIEQKGKYKKGKYNGKWTWYYENGNIWREEYYEEGKEEGAFVEYNDTGKVILKGQYFDGERTGYWLYSVGDIIEKGKYIEGLKDSTWISFYENGKICEEIPYMQGQQNGKYRWYYPNGNLKVEGYYIMGKKEKKWYYFDENGILYLTIQYRNDKEIKINGKKINLPKGSFD
ncbi:MAG: hypothetical protein N2449_02610 [Bacteroidales bacterium]|nr:hypothetical protein [Bacteroidales bacterium]